MGLLFAVAVVLSYIEGMVTIPGLPPGIKLGLSNIVTMYCVFFSGSSQCLHAGHTESAFGFADAGAYRCPAEFIGGAGFCNGDAVVAALGEKRPFLFGYQYFGRYRP